MNMKFSDFKALSFDCYGTLIDWEAGMLEALHPWLKAHGADPGNEAILQAFAEAESNAESEFPNLPYPKILGSVHEVLGRRFGVPSSEEEQSEFGKSIRHWPAFPDSKGALQKLAQRYKLFVLSNIDRNSFSQSNRRLGDVFSAVYTAEDIGTYKPDAHNFRYLIQHLRLDWNIPPHKILHVAQSLYHDHEPAKKLDLTTCWIDRRHGSAGGATRGPKGDATPDYSFTSLQGLVDAIEAEEAE